MEVNTFDDKGDEENREAAVDNQSSDAAAAVEGVANSRASKRVGAPLLLLLLLVLLLVVIVLAVTLPLVLDDDDEEAEEKLLCCGPTDDSKNENITDVPYDWNATQAPFDKATQAPPFDNTTQAPFHNITQAPYDNITQAPYNNITQAPPFDNTTQAPLFDNITQAPYDNITQAPYNNITQAPFDNATQAPYDWNCSEVANVTALYEASVSIMAELLKDHKVPPEHLTDLNNMGSSVQDGDFDVSLYLDVLKYLSLPEGTVLDYVYIFDGNGGFPLLYVRNQTDEPFATAADLMRAKDCSSSHWDCPNYLNEIIIHNSPQGFLQFVILDVKGNQFYLYWHSGYNDYEIITSSASVEEILQRHPPCGAGGDDWGCFGPEIFDMARSLDLTPTIQCNDDMVQVSVVLFTDWGGFVNRTYNISRAAGVGDRIVDTEQEVLVPFDIGMVF